MEIPVMSATAVVAPALGQQPPVSICSAVSSHGTLFTARVCTKSAAYGLGVMRMLELSRLPFGRAGLSRCSTQTPLGDFSFPSPLVVLYPLAG
jgi:hypothetical protein